MGTTCSEIASVFLILNEQVGLFSFFSINEVMISYEKRKEIVSQFCHIVRKMPSAVFCA